MTDQQVARHADDAGLPWTEQSERAWHLDLRMLTDAGIMLCRPDAPDQWSQPADRMLDRAHTTESAGCGQPGGVRS